MRLLQTFSLSRMMAGLAVALVACQAQAGKILVITGDEFHEWKKTAPLIQELLTKAGHTVDLTEKPGKDLTTENLAKYDAFVLNYRDTPNGAKTNPDSVWSDDNKKAFLAAVRGGKGLYVHHWSSAAFTADNPLNKEYEKVLAGGWRKQGNHGKKHEFTVAVRKEHPITAGLTEFKHTTDELYQNSVMFPGSVVLATAYADATIDPKNSGKHEAMVWTAAYGKGRVVENVLGHDLTAMACPGFQVLLVRGVEWAATGDTKAPVPQALKK